MLALAMKFSRSAVEELLADPLAPRARTLRTEQRARPVSRLDPGFLPREGGPQTGVGVMPAE